MSGRVIKKGWAQWGEPGRFVFAHVVAKCIDYYNVTGYIQVF